MEFFGCNHRDSPYCDCGMHAISKRMIELRREGLSPAQISRHFVRNYSITIYSGDVFSYLNEVVHKLEAVARIAHVYEKREVIAEVEKMKKEIEG